MTELNQLNKKRPLTLHSQNIPTTVDNASKNGTDVGKGHRLSLSKLQDLLQIQAYLTKAQKYIQQTLNSPKENPLTLDEFELGQFLGRGTYSAAYIVRHKRTGFFCCMKEMKREKIEQNMNTFIRGLKIQMFVDHPNIAKTYGIVVEKNKVYVFMQLCMDGDLKQNFKQIKAEKKQKECLRGVIKGVSYLHNNAIQHRDLKLENILICMNFIKITDFDFGTFSNQKTTKMPTVKRTTICGSPLYFSPEMLKDLSYSLEADIWSLGILMYELICGCFPFQIESIEDLHKITSIQINYPQSVDPVAKDLMSNILITDPIKRLNLEQILKHQYFQ